MANDITMPPVTDKTVRELIETLEKCTLIPAVGLTVVDNAVAQTVTVYDYNAYKADGYTVGDLCVYSSVIKRCKADTPTPAGAYDSSCWEDW